MMGIKLNKKVLGLGAALVGMVFGSAAANAGAMLVISDGITTETITDNGDGTGGAEGTSADLAALLGKVAYIGSLGIWNIAADATGLSKPAIGSAGNGEIHFNTLSANSSGAGTLTMYFSDTDFNSASADWLLGLLGGITEGSVEMDICFNDANQNVVDGASCTVVDTTGSLATPVVGWSGGGAINTTGGLFGMGIALRVTHTAGGQETSLDTALHVPEPGILGLFGFGLLGMGIAARRRRMI